MTRDRGPEEFFEVFRDVQSGKKKRQEGATQPAEQQPPAGPEPEAPAAGGPPQTLEVSYAVAAALVVGALLLVAGAYMLGKQQGWRAHAAAAGRVADRPQDKPATRESPTPVSTEPELVDGKILTLVTSGKTRQHLQWVQIEADYLNGYEPFRALRVQAYTYRDRSGAYRLCVRGMAAKTQAEREAAKAEIRKLKSRTKKREYKDADFFAP